MKKNTYERASVVVISLNANDVITTSGPIWGGNDDDAIRLPEDIF